MQVVRGPGSLVIETEPLVRGARQVFAKVEHGVDAYVYDTTLWTLADPDAVAGAST